MNNEQRLVRNTTYHTQLNHQKCTLTCHARISRSWILRAGLNIRTRSDVLAFKCARSSAIFAYKALFKMADEILWNIATFRQLTKTLLYDVMSRKLFSHYWPFLRFYTNSYIPPYPQIGISKYQGLLWEAAMQPKMMKELPILYFRNSWSISFLQTYYLHCWILFYIYM